MHAKFVEVYLFRAIARFIAVLLVGNRKIQLIDFIKLYPDLEDEDVSQKLSTEYSVCIRLCKHFVRSMKILGLHAHFCQSA